MARLVSVSPSVAPGVVIRHEVGAEGKGSEREAEGLTGRP